MAAKKENIGFGFAPRESEHHFMVLIHGNRNEPVLISEHFMWRGEEDAEATGLSFAPGKEDAKLKVILSRDKWDRIAEFVEGEFNNRLRKQSLKAGKWKTGENPVARLLGKELTLLAWAIEDADPALIPAALNNWQGLQSEERWWLFTMTNAATGHAVHGKNKGWRKAVRFALTENPTSDHMPQPGLELFELIRETVAEQKAGASKPRKKAAYKPTRKRKHV